MATHPSRLLIVAVVLLALPGGAAWAEDVVIGKTGYAMTVPDGLKPVADEKSVIKLQADDRTLIIQVNHNEGGGKVEDLAEGFQKGLSGPMPDLKVIDARPQPTALGRGLYRHYRATVNNILIDIQAVFVSSGKENLILQAISHKKDLDALRKHLASVRPVGRPAPVDDGPAQQPTVPIGDSGYSIAPPAEMKVVRNPSVTLQMTNEADNILIQAMVAGKDRSIQQMIEGYEKEMAANAKKWEPKSRRRFMLLGAPAELRAYDAQLNDIAFLCQTLFFARGDDRLAIHVFSQGRPAEQMRQILLTLSDGKTVGGSGRPLAYPGYRLHVESDVGLVFELPADWATHSSATRDATTFKGPADREFARATINLQLLGRKHEEHRDLATSLAELHRQVKANAGGKILSEIEGEAAGRPMRVVDYTMVFDGLTFRFKMIVMELPEAIIWWSFVAPEEKFAPLRPIGEHMVSTVRPLAGAAPDAPAPPQ